MEGEFILRLPLATHAPESVDSRITLPLQQANNGCLGELSSSEEEDAEEEDDDEDDDDDEEEGKITEDTLLTLPLVPSTVHIETHQAPQEPPTNERVESEGESDEENQREFRKEQRRKARELQMEDEDVSGLRRSGRKRTTRLDPSEFELSFSDESVDSGSDGPGGKPKKRRRKQGKKPKGEVPVQDFKLTLEKPRVTPKAGVSGGSGAVSTLPAKTKGSKPPKLPSSSQVANAKDDALAEASRVGRKKMSIRQRLVKKLGIKRH